MTTIRQLAKLAGVSIATVSRALTGAPRISPETRARILELAELYQYSPNRIPPPISTEVSQPLGLVLPNIRKLFNSRIAAGVLSQSFSESYHTVILENHANVLHTCKAMEVLADLRVGGVLIVTGHGESIPREPFLQLWSRQIPVILIDAAVADVPADRVMSDEHAIGRQAVEYLCALGHQRIAYVGPVATKHSFRQQAIYDILKGRGYPTEYFYQLAGDDEQEIADIVQRILHAPHRPTALIGFHDDVALGLIKELSRQGYHVPRDFSVLGFGNLYPHPNLSPYLTTFEQFPEEIGQKAVKLLLQRIAEKSCTGYAVEEVQVPPKLVVRNTCAKLVT